MLKNDINEYYWLGFVYADGNLCDYIVKGMHKTRRTFSLHVAEKDRAHLELLASVLGLTVYTRTATNAALISTCKRSIVEYFTEAGIKPRKSLSDNIVDMMAGIPDTEMWNFTRGYFDGDGCITNYTANHKNGPWKASKIVIVGSNGFVQYLIHFLSQHGIPAASEMQNGLYKCVIRNKASILKLRDFMYGGAGTFLHRKFDKFNAVVIKEPVKYRRHIYYRKDREKWVALAEKDSIKKFLGSFVDRESAEAAFTEYAK